MDPPIVTAWVRFMVWEVMRDTKYRMTLRIDDEGRKGLSGVNVRKRLLSVWAAHWIGAWRGARGWINSRELFALRLAGTLIGASAAWTLGRAYDRVVTPESLVTTSAQIEIR